MASYHLSAKIVARSTGRSSVAAAAYRSRSAMTDKHQGVTFDYTKKRDLVHSEILLPESAPDRLRDREALWNEIERIEKRKDAQLAREIEVALPRELNLEEQKELLREFIHDEFISLGMIADLNIHHHKENPHAHIMLTTRKITKGGFDRKVREWNRVEKLSEWRRKWAEKTNEKLLAAGYDTRVDHRSYKEQGIDLVPQRHLSYNLKFVPRHYLNLAEMTKDNVAEHVLIRQLNGEKIISDPDKAVHYLTHYNVAFREKDIDTFLNSHTFGNDQFQTAKDKILSSAEIVRLAHDEKGEKLYTTKTMLEKERVMLERAEYLDVRMEHPVAPETIKQTLANYQLNEEQRNAFRYTVSGGDITMIMGRAGTGKSYALRAIREAYEVDGYRVRGIALSGIAAENLEVSSGITSTTIYSQLNQWIKGEDPLTSKDVLVIDEVGFVGTRQMHDVVSYAHASGAKLIMTGDNEQLPAIEAGGAARGIMERVGYTEISKVMRQRETWQAQATMCMSSPEGHMKEAIDLYDAHGNIKGDFDTRDEAKAALIEEWKSYTTLNPRKSSLILTYANRDIADLNEKASNAAKAVGRVGDRDFSINTEKHGPKPFAKGDRIVFLERNRTMDVKNGSLGTIRQIDTRGLLVDLDNGATVAFDPRDYRNIDHGYAMTTHKAQGATVDRSFVLVTKRFDKHVTYVALSRHRDDVTIYHSASEFPDRNDFITAVEKRSIKALVHDFAYHRGYEVGEGRGEFQKIMFSNKEYRIPTGELDARITGVYHGDVQHEGKRYHRIEGLTKQQRYLVPATEKGVEKNLLLRNVQYDGTSVTRIPEMAKTASIGKELNTAKERE